jgi:RimJ/RimL family protein N-acetyltransferase
MLESSPNDVRDTARREVTLDFFVPSDAPVLCEVDNDPEHRRRFDFRERFVASVEHSRAVIARWTEERRAGVRFPFAVRDGASGALVGGCELKPLGHDTANISYWTHPLHRRRGIASEAVRQVCALAFTEFGFRRLELRADVDNVGSRRIAARHGFTEVGMREGRVLYILEAAE